MFIKNNIFEGKEAILLDMNGTFMFGEDRFSLDENFYSYYRQLDGKLSEIKVNEIIRSAYDYLESKYHDERYVNNFPSVEKAILNVINFSLSDSELKKLVDTFSYHELGNIPLEFVVALYKLKKHFTLACVIDIWSPNKLWRDAFVKAEVYDLFSVLSFSSDEGIVKPSPEPFEKVLEKLELTKDKVLIVGDSIRRDLGGATASEIDCVLVGGAMHEDAVGTFSDLIELSNSFFNGDYNESQSIKNI
ncbi:hypothetical protein MNBD_GAMMA05-1111 [hydrothermal vent metagenome]|uniref:Uncharacterized protein n=1 Tax=hydrothermal vent metagenome TaxID=652676 RepID=A0A3B0W9B0_9ZZZZ